MTRCDSCSETALLLYCCFTAVLRTTMARCDSFSETGYVDVTCSSAFSKEAVKKQ
jgi:hypothetical protein